MKPIVFHLYSLLQVGSGVGGAAVSVLATFEHTGFIPVSKDSL